MHTIEFDGSAPNPGALWKVTTDDGAQWHAATEPGAAEQLREWIERRQAQDERAGFLLLPPGAVLL
jgi:hypothetical protein